MSLKSPFSGELFDAMMAEAAYNVASQIAKAGNTTAASELPKVRSVMLTYLEALQNGTSLHYKADGTTPAVVSSISTSSGIDYTSTETILGEVELETATGGIPAWYLDPASLTASFNESHDEAKALRAPFIYRVAKTILDPWTKAAQAAGVELPSLSTIVTFLKAALVVALLVGAAYAYNAFRKRGR